MLSLCLTVDETGREQANVLCCGQKLVVEEYDYAACAQCATAYTYDELCALVHKAIAALTQLVDSLQDKVNAQGVQRADNASHGL